MTDEKKDDVKQVQLSAINEFQFNCKAKTSAVTLLKSLITLLDMPEGTISGRDVSNQLNVIHLLLKIE